MSGEEIQASQEKNEETFVEELINTLWEILQSDALVLIKNSGPLNDIEERVEGLEQISLIEIEKFKKEQRGWCQKCEEPILKDLQYRYDVGVFLDESSGEPIAIYVSYQEIRYDRSIIENKTTLVAGLKETKIKLETIKRSKGVAGEIKRKWETKPPLVIPKSLNILRKLLQHRIAKLKEGKYEKSRLLHIYDEVLHTIERPLAEKALELEKNISDKKVEVFCPKWILPLVSEWTAEWTVEHMMERAINKLLWEGGLGLESLEKWLSPLKCNSTVQHNEHVKRATTCLGSLLDLHVHIEYETVEKDEGLAITAGIKLIHMREGNEQH
jgi:hypothetical protein